jgi:sugar phosphate isomerase/epimerase
MLTENRLTNASLSTMWAINNYPDLNDFFHISRQLGFQKIELNHQVDTRMLSTIDIDHLQFSSVHEPCPADVSTKELINRDWIISSDNEEFRLKGVEFVKNSINLANKINAPVVVIHCGNVTADASLESRLRRQYKAAQTGSCDYQKLKDEIVQTRSNQVGPRLQAVKKSLLELIDYAIPLNVQLGLENRYHIMDIPILEEMDELLSLADSTVLGFIYDVGHTQALDRLGFFTHEEWLKRYSSRMIGCHLHDVRGLTDHLAPGLGEMDFRWISNYLPEDAFRTIELQPGNTLAQVKNGVIHLLGTGCINSL